MSVDFPSNVVSVPSVPSTDQPNSSENLQIRMREGRLTWLWPLIMCFIRFPLLVIGFFLVLFVASRTGHTDVAMLAQGITRYDLPLLADMICLGLLFWLVRKENMRLRDLVCFTRKHLLRDLCIGVGLFVSLYIVLFALSAGGVYLLLSHTAFFRNGQVLEALFGNTLLNPLGLPWHIAITTLLLPISSALLEEMVYRGYALPRLQVLTRRKWLAVLLTASGFGVQHIAFGLLYWPLAVFSFLLAFIPGVLLGILYLLTRQRLLPLILIHWQADLITLGAVPLLLTMFFHNTPF